ncbi:MAG: hypothetical protein KatS3mg089_0564 [Patescibacteria group bacterium]|nr:MAG: hypothetical protein KatS3mg089_0564 [Patescibacteria group bacterium]
MWMRNTICILIIVLAGLAMTQRIYASTSVKINNSINSNTSSQTKSSTETNVRIETNGEVKTFHATDNESVNYQSEDGSIKVNINNNNASSATKINPDDSNVALPQQDESTPNNKKSDDVTDNQIKGKQDQLTNENFDILKFLIHLFSLLI